MTPNLTTKSLEIRLNSVDDAKSVVYNSGKILKTVQERGLDSIQFLIAKEVRSQVDEVIRGVFNIKTFTQSVIPQPGNSFFPIPHFKVQPQRIVIKNEVLPRTNGSVPVSSPKPPQLEVKKRGGRPKGSKNKPKAEETAET